MLTCFVHMCILCVCPHMHILSVHKVSSTEQNYYYLDYIYIVGLAGLRSEDALQEESFEPP